MNSNSTKNKMNSDNTDDKFYAIDLFAGCGGLSEGFSNNGFNVIAHVEKDNWACETLKSRHLYWELKRSKKEHLYTRFLCDEISRDDILKNNPDINKSVSCSVIQATFGEDFTDDIVSKIKSSMDFHDASKIHVLLGGPPCQPYSLAGRSRDPNRMENDERHFLYKYYLSLLECLQPDFFVYENVPGLFTARAKGEITFHKMFEDFSSLKQPYCIVPELKEIYKNPNLHFLKSINYQVPQNRKRLILIGYKKSLEKKNPRIAEIIDKLQLEGERNSQRKLMTVRDALGDLPGIEPGNGKDGWFGPYHTNENLTFYQKKMRAGSPGVLNHRARTHMESDIERYKFFIEHHLNGNGAATLNELLIERPDLVPNHKHLDKFIDRFKVQWWDKPSSTIMAHICKDGHYYIHPDITQCRSFTVREAARCQSFPDNFKFEGPRTEQFRQVGNAVPPLLADSIGRAIKRELRVIYDS
jgi:DNA (cytosine-5)-methyltransferase 1